MAGRISQLEMSGCASSLLRRRGLGSDLISRLFRLSLRFQSHGLGTFGLALGIIFRRGLRAFGGSFGLLELSVCPFAFLGIVGQRGAPFVCNCLALGALLSILARNLAHEGY